jgi:hypothetical protein
MLVDVSGQLLDRERPQGGRGVMEQEQCCPAISGE